MSKENLDSPNLFVGKLIGNSRIEGKVVSITDNGFSVEVTLLNDTYFERYMDVGKIYPLFQHKHWSGDLLLWEVKAESMKRNVSQILLQWEKDIGWTWDLDS